MLPSFILSMFTRKKSSRVYYTVSPKFSFFKYIITVPISFWFGFQWLSHLYLGYTLMVHSKKHIRQYLTLWTLATLEASCLDTYTRLFQPVLDHIYFCEAWVHSHCCLHLTLGKLLVHLGIGPSQWVPVEMFEINALAYSSIILVPLVSIKFWWRANLPLVSTLCHSVSLSSIFIRPYRVWISTSWFGGYLFPSSSSFSILLV